MQADKERMLSLKIADIRRRNEETMRKHEVLLASPAPYRNNYTL